jgi:hypothetical protein
MYWYPYPLLSAGAQEPHHASLVVDYLDIGDQDNNLFNFDQL